MSEIKLTKAQHEVLKKVHDGKNEVFIGTYTAAELALLEREWLVIGGAFRGSDKALTPVFMIEHPDAWAYCKKHFTTNTDGVNV